MNRLYLCDVITSTGIRSVLVSGVSMEAARTNAGLRGSPVSDPEPLEKITNIEYHEHYAIERDGNDIIHHAFKDIPL